MEELNGKSIEMIAKLARAGAGPLSVSGANVPCVLLPEGYKVQAVPELVYNEHAATPERKKGTAKVLDASSFCEYYTLFHDENSRVFADEMRFQILAVLDYHAPGPNAPRWGQHRLEFTMRPSEEWTTWKGADGKKFDQMGFAEFIEDNQPDISDPSGATMLEVARDLSAKSGADFSSAISQSNGSVKLHYTEQVKGTYGNGDLEVPERFNITIPIFIGSEPETITARLRYRLNSGKVVFWFDLLRASNTERKGFLKAHEAIAKALGLTIINGTPA